VPCGDLRLAFPQKEINQKDLCWELAEASKELNVVIAHSCFALQTDKQRLQEGGELTQVTGLLGQH
jgi:hypothetical protein